MKKLFACGLIALASLPAGAQSTWSGTTDNFWTTAGNWSVPPVSSSALQVVFGPTAATFTPNADAPFTLNRLSILGAPPYLLSGSMLTFAGANALLAVSGAGHVVQNIVRFNADLELTATDDVTLPGGTTGGGIIAITATGARVTVGGASSNLGGTGLLSGTLRFGDGVSCPANVSSIQSNGAVEFAPLPTTTLNGDIGGLGTVRILSGELVVTGTLLNAGTTTVDAGATLTGLIDNNALLTVNGRVTTDNSTVGSLAGIRGPAGTGVLDFTSGTFTTGGDNTDQSFAGNQLVGTGNFVKVGSGRQSLATALTHSGTTTISGGVLAFGTGGADPGLVAGPIIDNAALEFNVIFGVIFGAVTGSGTLTVVGGFATSPAVLVHTGTTTVNSGATLASTSINNAALLTVNGTYSALDSTVGSLAGAGNVNVNGAALVVGGDNTSTTFSGALRSTGNFTKVGTGTLTLTGVSTLTGVTTVSGGTLLVNGTLPGAIVVGPGATLGGTGTVGALIVNAGGTLAPGLSPGVLNTGNVALAGILLQEIDGPALGTQYDNMNTTGTVDLTGATLTLAGVYVPLLGDTFTVVSNDGADPVVGSFAGLAEGATIVFNGVTLEISYVGGTGNDVLLAVVAPAPAGVGGPPIPTLSEWMLVLLALLMMTVGLRSRSFRNNR